MNDRLKEDINERNSSFELLRILLILMIIALHYCNANYGGALGNVEKGSFNYWIVHFIESACIVAVNVFVIITGYFMNDRTEVKINKVINIVYLTVIWGIIIYIIALFSGKTKISLESFVVFVDTITNRWFVVIYCLLYLLIPYINKFIHTMNKEQYTVLLSILVCTLYVYSTVFKTTVAMVDRGYGIANFIVLYLIGSYIKIYHDDFKSLSKSIVMYLLCVVCTTLLSNIDTSKAWQYNSIFNLIGSVSLFFIFKSIKMKNIKVINWLASYTFSAYIIHENKFIINNLYKEVFNCTKYYNRKALIINLGVSVLGIYIICIVAETIRRLIMKKYIDKQINKMEYSIKM